MLLIYGTAVLLCGAASSYGAEAAPAPADAVADATVPATGVSAEAYTLFARDVVKFSVYGEPDLSTQLRISGTGSINVPLLGDIQVSGLKLAAAEKKIQQAYIDGQILIQPQITIQVAEYSKKEISILGQIGRQGNVELPVESTSISIINAITLAGGFTRIGRADNVKVTRKKEDGKGEEVFIVNVEKMISGGGKERVFYLKPGDVVFVAERLF